jgi:vacuolar-type H+-ATPase subunit E/Vma4
MPYETLIAALLQEGDAKCKAILRKAQAEADHLIAEANMAAAALEREADAQVRREAAKQRIAVLGRATLAGRRILLETKHEVLEAVWRRVSERASALTGSERAGVLRALLDELLAVVPQGPLKAVIEGRERSHLEGLLVERKIPFERRRREDLLLGIALEAGGELLRNSLASRLAKAKPDLVIELNRLLFAPHPDPLPACGERDG